MLENFQKLASYYVNMRERVSESSGLNIVITVDRKLFENGFEELQQMVSSFKTDLIIKDNDIGNLKTYSRGLADKIKYLESKIKELESEVGGSPLMENILIEVNKQQKYENVELNNEIEELKTRLKQTEEHNVRLNGQLKNMKENNREKDLKILEYANDIEHIKTREAAVIKENRYLNLISQAEDAEAKKLQTQNNELLAEVKQVKEYLTNKEKTAMAFEEKIKLLQGQIDTQEQKFKEELEILNKQIEEKKLDKYELLVKNKDLKDLMRSNEVEQRKKIESFEEKIADLENLLRSNEIEHNKKTKGLETSMGVLNRSNTKHMVEAHLWKLKLANSEKQNVKLLEEKKLTETKIETIESKLNLELLRLKEMLDKDIERLGKRLWNKKKKGSLRKYVQVVNELLQPLQKAQ